MPEILTESFCERCGTRYTFQSSAPKVGRMAKFKVLSRGLKNYVLSDETSLDEALADARSVDDREHSVEQLDAFHKTFNFCMSCRQYTCANCWNDREGRCLSCAPSLSVGVLPSGMPALNPIAGMASLTNGNGAAGNGHAPLQADGSAWPDADLGIASDDASFSGVEEVEEKPVSRLEALFGREEAARIKASAPVYDDAEPTSVPEMIGLEESRSKDRKATPKPVSEPLAAVSDVAPEADETVASAPPLPTIIGGLVEIEAQDVAADPVDDDVAAIAAVNVAAIAAADVAADDEPDAAIAAAAEIQVDAGPEASEAPEPLAAIHAEPIPVRSIDPETDELAAAAAAQTHGLLDKFRARPVAIPEPKPILSTPTVPRVVVPPTPLVAAAPPPAVVPVPLPPTVPAPAHLPYAAAGPMAVPAAPQPYGAIGRPSTEALPAYPGRAAMPYAAQAPASPPYEPAAPQPYAGPIGQPYTPAAAPIQPYPAPPQPQGGPAPAMYPPFQPGYTTPPLQPQYAPPPPPQYAPPPPAAPSWRMVAPESPYVAPASGNGHVYSAPPAPSANEPQWPDAPSWPTPVPPASRTRGAEAVWAESTRDLLSRPETGVSACFNCGLPLSATARFCRRCGTSQVSS